MNRLLHYLQSNKEWLFSGLGIATLSTLFWTLQQSFESFRNAKRGSVSKYTSGDIRVIGPRAAGKTVYLAALADWHNLGNISPIYSVEPINDYAANLVLQAQHVLRNRGTL